MTAGCSLRNFRPAGFATPPGEEIHVGADGLVKAKPEAGAKDIDCGGAWLSPGWTDLHVHVWHGGTDISVRAADVGRATGVTAFVDAGSAGEGSFAGLREYVLDRCEETVRAFVNISSIGLVCCNRIPELLDARFIDVGRTMAVIEANRDVVCGVKIRASGVIVGSWGAGPVRIAKRVAQMAGLPLMAHIGEPPPIPDEVLDVLEPGDVVTHCFNGKPGGSLTDAPAVFALAKEAAARGILMDVGHGAASFDFDAARRAIDGGLRPYSISTDLHRENIDGPVHDMATTMAKLHAVGLDFEECVAAAAARPRDFLGLEAGAAPGARADYTVFDCVDCDLEVRDSMGKKLRLRRMFEPRRTVIGASVKDAARRVPN